MGYNEKRHLDSIKASIGASSPKIRAELRNWIATEYNPDGEDNNPEVRRLFYFLDDTEEYTSEQREFLNTISGDDLSAILKGQIYIERIIEQFIAHHISGSEVMFNGFLSYAEKVELLRMLKIDIPKELITRLRRLAEVRNSFGHRIEKHYFEKSDADLLDFKLGEKTKTWLEASMREYYPDDTGHGDRTRLLIFLIWMDLAYHRTRLYGPQEENVEYPEDRGA